VAPEKPTEDVEMSRPEASHETGPLLQRVIAEIPTKGDFPAVARVIDDLRAMAGRENCAALDVARVVLRDPGFSSKLLRLVNSAFYRRQGEPVSTVTRAVMMVGFEAIRDLASIILIVEDLLRAGKSNAYVRDGLRSALYRGLLSQRLSGHVGYPKPEEAYLLGLFGDLGTLWLATHYPAEFARATTRAAARGLPIEAGVREVLGGETATLSAAIAEAWGFPATFAAHFHGPALRRRDALNTAGARLSAIVQIANEWTRAMEAGRKIDPAVLARGEALLDISADQLVTLAREAHEVLREQVAALGLGRVTELVEPGAAKAADAPLTSPAPLPDPPSPARSLRDEGSALQAVADITRSIIERRDINDILLMVLESLVHVGGFDAAFLALVTVQRDRLVGRLACGAGAEAHLGELNAPLAGGNILADVVLDRRAQVVAPGTAPAPASPLLTAAALMAAPLVVREQCVGLVVATRAPEREITAADQSLVELLCNQAAVALHHVSG
jgi:eukaryotic-like serine/threonine-protein kinase